MISLSAKLRAVSRIRRCSSVSEKSMIRHAIRSQLEMAPETRYARSGDIHIAYQAVGDGPVDLIWVPTWIWHSEHVWEEPSAARMFQRLTNFSRLIMFDRRG